MTELWIVLRHSSDGLSATASRMSEGQGPQLEIGAESVPTAAVGDLLRDPSTIMAAPDMPTRLIRPFGKPSSHDVDAWGIEAVGALDCRYDGSGVKVAVLDTGIDGGHPAFTDVKLIQRDFTGMGNGDVDGHGTHCAGTIFGRDVTTRIGIARGVTEAFIGKVLDDRGQGTALDTLRGMLWAAENGANVISMSLGFDTPGYVERLIEAGWPDKLAAARGLDAFRRNIRLFDAQVALLAAKADIGQHTLVVAATGNESERDVDPEFRIPASLPAATTGVVSVGALARTSLGLSIAPFSNSLPAICGPGVDIISAEARKGGLVSLSGTSMACPHVAGVAALWWQALGSHATAETVRAKLVGTASHAGLTPGYDHTDVGMGMVRAP